MTPIGLTQNLLANFAGSSWIALSQLVVVPLYVRLIGIESYALVGFYAVLLTVSQVLDLGISPTINRQLARYSVAPANAQQARDLVRTVEVGYWLAGVAIGLGIALAAPLVAQSWFGSSSFPAARLEDAIVMMGVLVALQWPLSFYYGGLSGLQRQVVLNSLKIGFGLFATIGAVLTVALVSRSVEALFIWLIAAAAVQILGVTIAFWRQMPRSGGPARFRPNLMKLVWRFAVGMSSITLASLVLTQLDKIVLSRILDLASFGYYLVAGVVASSLFIIVAPVFGAVLPRMSTLVAAGNDIALARLYHFAAQLMTALVAPVALILMLFSYDLLKIWLGNAETAERCALIASTLVAGTAINALANVPYALQLAYGWTRMGAYLGGLMLLLFVPTLIPLASTYGGIGAALAWALMNAVYFMLAIPLTHRRLLRGEMRQLLVGDTALPLVAAASVVFFGRLLLEEPLEAPLAIYALGALLLASVFAASSASSELRPRLWSVLMKR